MPAPLLDALARDPVFLTTRVAIALASRCRAALRARGIDDVNPAQLCVLIALDGQDGLTPTALSRLVRYEKSTLTPLLMRLERAGLVVRGRDPNDARVHRLVLTKKGRRRRREAADVLAEVSGGLSGALPRKLVRRHAEFCRALIELEAEADAAERAKADPAPTRRARTTAAARP